MNILEEFKYCPICGSSHFEENSGKSKLCHNCGFEYFVNPSSANVAFILNEKDELLVATRKKEPAKGTLDLPGGFADVDETSEQAVTREVKEETCMEVIKTRYLFSLPNKYRYCGIDIPTLDMFYLCKVKKFSGLKADDDVASLAWIPLKDIRTELFGLRSVRQGLLLFIKNYQKD